MVGIPRRSICKKTGQAPHPIRVMVDLICLLISQLFNFYSLLIAGSFSFKVVLRRRMGALRPYPSLFLPNLLRPNLLRPKSWVQFIKITQDRPLALLHSRPTNLIHMTLNTDLVYQKCAALYRCSSCNHPSSDLIPDPKYNVSLPKRGVPV